jgi:NAD-dependent deacetylase
MNFSRYNVVAITGAGLSEESGIPTYRGANGIYTTIEKELGEPIEKIISAHTAKHRPELFWRYWWSIYSKIKSCEPNEAHRLLKKISNQSKSFVEITQNIDGYSVLAGIDEKHVIELHGTANTYSCIRCGQLCQLNNEQSGVPKCSTCIDTPKSILRPRIVMFGESIKSKNYKSAISASSKADVLLVIGTELHFSYLIDFLMAARRNNALIIFINPVSFDHIKELDQQYYIRSIYDVINIEQTASIGLRQLLDEQLPPRPVSASESLI